MLNYLKCSFCFALLESVCSVTLQLSTYTPTRAKIIFKSCHKLLPFPVIAAFQLGVHMLSHIMCSVGTESNANAKPTETH